jgi:hypothetical protein
MALTGPGLNREPPPFHKATPNKVKATRVIAILAGENKTELRCEEDGKHSPCETININVGLNQKIKMSKGSVGFIWHKLRPGNY